MTSARCLAALLCLLPSATAWADGCTGPGVWLQVLGGYARGQQGELSSSYLVWIDGKARVLVDAGTGSATQFANSGASVADLDLILFSQLHVNNAGDLPAIVQLSLSEKRERPLLIYGPDRSRLMPSTITYVRTLFDPKRGVYRYLGELLNPLGKEPYKLQPHDVEVKPGSALMVYRNQDLRVTAVNVKRDPFAQLAWGVQATGKLVVFNANGSDATAALAPIARGADMLIMHAPDGGGASAEALAATARMAADLKVKEIALTGHLDSAGQREQETTDLLAKVYDGRISFPRALACFAP